MEPLLKYMENMYNTYFADVAPSIHLSSLPLNEDEPHEMKTAWESRSRVGSFDQMLVKSGVE